MSSVLRKVEILLPIILLFGPASSARVSAVDIQQDEFGYADSVINKVVEIDEQDPEYLRYLGESEYRILGFDGPIGVEFPADIERLLNPLAAEERPSPSRPVKSSPPAPVQLSSRVERWRPLVEAYFPGDWVNWALRIIQCESEGDPNAANPDSSARGLFQHLGKYWEERSADAGWAGADIFDPEANVAVAAYLLRRDGTWHWTCKASK